MAKVEAQGDCLVWTGCRINSGYGVIRHNGKQALVHRLAYEFEVGPIPDGLVIDHLCRNRVCVNPEHLEPVTSAENVRRWSRTVTHCPYGHEYTPENTRQKVNRLGNISRACRTCDASGGAGRRKARQAIEGEATP